MIDVQRARRETPGCEHVTHLDNAGASLPPQPVLDAVIGHLQLEARVGGYEAHEQNEKAIDRFYGAAAIAGLTVARVNRATSQAASAAILEPSYAIH